MIRLLFVLALCAAPLPALAHKVIASVFPSGSDIEGEIGFSNGDVAAGARVEVTSDTGAPLGQTTTDAEGFFLFTPTEPVTHLFRSDLGAGHVALIAMEAHEVAEILGGGLPVSAPLPAPPRQDSEALAKMIRDELRPLRREIAAYKEKNDMQTILGGIGYIFGLFGIGFYIAARNRMKGDGS